MSEPIDGLRTNIFFPDSQPTGAPSGTVAADASVPEGFVVVSPASNSKISEILPVSSTVLVVPGDAPALDLPPITLERGTLVTGQVFGAGLVQGAHVELIRTVDGRAISLGRADSDERGQVRFVLPLDRPAPP